MDARNLSLPVLSVCLALGGCVGDLGLPSGPDDGSSSASGTASGVDPDSLAGSPIGDELAEHCEGGIDPGRVLLHRLNRVELGYTLADLTGLDMGWGQDLPADESAAGFDNQASALAMAPLHVEKYFDTAQKVVAAILADSGARRRAIGDLTESSVDAKLVSAVSDFGSRAFRRPLSADEAARLVSLYTTARDKGASFDVALSVVLRAILAAPSFVFHRPLLASADAAAQRLDAHGVASRLSYFLWSSLPDAALRAAADADELRTPAQVEAQIRRMLRDPKAERFVQSFAGQWLDLRALSEAKPDVTLFPAFTPELRDAMERESYALFRSLLSEGTDVRDLLVGGYSYLSSDLAQYYGVGAGGLDAEMLTRVELSGSGRIGFLTQGSFLTLTSHPERTSLVKRGKWVLEQLLCSAPPPPPPGVEALPIDQPGSSQDRSLREMVEEHRANPACAGCHASMDPIGFGLEHFDPVGAFRSEDRGFAIDASGELPDADGKMRPFQGAVELSELVADDPRLLSCMADKLFTFALSRAPVASDACTLDALEARLSKGGHSLFDLIVSTAQVPAFTHASPEATEE